MNQSDFDEEFEQAEEFFYSILAEDGEEKEKEPIGPKKAEKRVRNRMVDEMYEWVEWAASIAIFVVLLLTFVVRTVGVYGPSMENTLIEGDSLLVTRVMGDPQCGDIVAITQPNASHQPLIKRVIATGGQTIDINYDTGDVSVDGVLLYEPYIAEPTYLGYDLEFPIVVPEGYTFVMGDNRNHSWDSRASGIGMIDNRYILGTVVFRFMPFDRIGKP